MVAFADHGDKVKTIRINKLTTVRRRWECGFKCIECEIGAIVDNQDMAVNGLKVNVMRYCLLLPFVYNNEGNFGNQYAIVYEDWEVCTELGYRELIHVCETLSEDSVLSNN